jgi:UDP-3-O-[3-hydroxymyristoyl] glucosamine N-acyltransferase
MIAGKSAVAGYKRRDGKVLRGSPALPIAEANRFYVLRKKIPDLFARVANIEKTLKIQKFD